jgi:hypothetical protein
MAVEDNESVRVITTFEGKRLHRLLDWWRGIRSTGALPCRADFRLAEWKAHLPWIAVAEVMRGASGELADGLIKVWGTGLSDPFGGDVTGQKLSDFGEPYVRRWMAPARIVEETLEPVAVTGRVLMPRKDFQRFEIVFLPLFDTNGRFERLLTESELLPQA